MGKAQRIRGSLSGFLLPRWSRSLLRAGEEASLLSDSWLPEVRDVELASVNFLIAQTVQLANLR